MLLRLREEIGHGKVQLKNNSREFSMLDKKITASKEAATSDEVINLESLAELAGFPVELVKSELWSGEDVPEHVSMDELRSVMMDYIDKAMLSQ